MNWEDVFEKAVDYATEAFSWVAGDVTENGGREGGMVGWIEDNPNTADLLAGVAGGAASAYVATREGEATREFAREEAERQRQYELDSQKITPVSIDNYDSHAQQLGGGLITKGMISGSNKSQIAPDNRRHRFQ